MTAAETQKLIDEGVAILKGTTVGYAGHSTAWQQNQSTKWWQGLDKLAQARKSLDPVAGGYTIAAPHDPITRTQIHLYQAPGTATDYVIDWGNDSPVLIEPKAAGSKVARVRSTNIGATPAVGWAIHALYAKALNLTIEDYWAQTTANVTGECFSLRMAGAVLRRFHGEGPTHAHLISYFEELQPDGTVVKGTVLVEDGDGDFHNIQTAIWLATNSAPYCAQAFTFRNVHARGPGAFFVRADPLTWRGTVRIEGCTLNGKPVTSAMTNIPGAVIV